jgi:hypothetical protein
MENYQQEGGSIAVPDVLQGYMGGKTVIEKSGMTIRGAISVSRAQRSTLVMRCRPGTPVFSFRKQATGCRICGAPQARCTACGTHR